MISGRSTIKLEAPTVASSRPPLPGLALHHATLQRVRDVARHLQGRLGLKKENTPPHQLTNSPVHPRKSLAG